MNYRHIVVFVGFFMAASSPALAQDDGAFEEITVTAQHREQSLQEVPVAVTAVSAEDIVAFNINESGRLEMMTPGLVWGNGGGARAWPTLRGVETGNGEANGEPSIAFLVDGVYKSRSAQANVPLVDVERVEVLRGPQGTLFGRNSTGGAINVITANPSTEKMDYFIDATFGNYSNAKIDAMLNMPLSDSWALRLSARQHTRDGYQENTSGPDPMDEDMYYVRAGLGYEGENAEAVFKIGYRSVDRVGGGAFTSKVIGQSYDSSIPGRSVFGDAVFVNPRISDGDPDINVGGVPTDVGVAIDPDPFKISLNWPISEELESTDISLDWSYHGETMTFRSVTGIADFDTTPFGDNDYTDRSDIRNRVDALTAKAETFSQEFQLISTTDSTLEWMVGLFYLDDSVDETFSIQDFDENDNPNNDAFPAPGGGMTSFVFDRRTNTDIEATAIYGQLAYNFSEQLRGTLGYRYSEDDKKYKLREFGFLGVLGFNPDLDLSEKFDDDTWRIGLEYFTENGMVYGSISTGFRSGGFNRFNDDPATPENETIFDSETITAYEFGWKNTLADGRMRLNLAAFLQDLEDQQVSTVISVAGTGQSGFFNAGESEISGLEAEMDWRPTDAFRIYGNLTLMDAEYKEFMSPGFSGDTGQVDLAGNAPPRAPDFKGAIALSYDVAMGGGGSLTPSVTAHFSDDYFNTQFNTSIDKQDGFTKLDVRLTYITSNQAWRIEAYGENITEEEVASYGVFGGSNAFFTNYAPPATYGIRFTYRAPE